MKYLITTTLMLFVLLLLLPACNEVPPYIDFNAPDTSNNNNTASFDTIYKDTTFISTIAEPQARNVLIEEFTGVRCVTCPAGHEQTQAILNAHPNRVFAAVIHAGDLTDPYPNSVNISVITEGTALYNYLSAEAVPSAAINRVKYEDESTIAILPPSKWAAKVTTELAKPTPVNVYAYKNYNPNSRLLEVFVQLKYTQTISAPTNISVSITENNVIDPQVQSNGQVIDNYNHKHVLRAMMTFATGNLITQATTAGSVIVKKYTLILPNNWKANDLQAVAFVTTNADNNKEILQAAAVNVQ